MTDRAWFSRLRTSGQEMEQVNFFNPGARMGFNSQQNVSLVVQDGRPEPVTAVDDDRLKGSRKPDRRPLVAGTAASSPSSRVSDRLCL